MDSKRRDSSFWPIRVGAVIAVCGVLLSACANGQAATVESSAPPKLAPADVVAEYEAAEAAYGFDAAFPADVELPSLSARLDRLRENADGPLSFEEGYGESELVTMWRCAWQRSYFNAVMSSDEEAEARAADELSRHYYEIEAVQRRVSDPGRVFDKEVIQPALRGDLGPLEDDLRLSCGAPFVP